MAVVVRDVWDSNLDDELNLVRECLGRFYIASFDTEFPGSIFTTHVPFSKLSLFQLYSLMKKNVDALKLVQLGLTLSDTCGNLPSLGTEFQYVWQFNFRDFDPDRDHKDPESISFLQKQGIDFVKNTNMGIHSRTFALKFHEYGLGRDSGLTWVTFHGLYDYGYLIKILTGRPLPCDSEEFTALMQLYLGLDHYDTKVMANELGMYGGLEKIAKRLNLKRVVGNSHQAGSDSLLTMHLFLELSKNFMVIPILVVNKFNIMCRSNRLCPIPNAPILSH